MNSCEVQALRKSRDAYNGVSGRRDAIKTATGRVRRAAGSAAGHFAGSGWCAEPMRCSSLGPFAEAGRGARLTMRLGFRSGLLVGYRE